MYYIYIDNDLTSQTLSLEKLYSADPEDIADGYVVYDASAEKELNSAGSASFTVPPGNPQYNYIYKLKTSIFIFWESDLLWSGRVLNIFYDMYRNKSVQCEGTLAFLNDIQIKPFIYPAKTSLATHFSNIFGIYNNRCSLKRAFSNVGTDFPSDFNSTDFYSSSGITSYISVKEEIDNIRSCDNSVALAVVYSGLALPTLYFAKIPFQTIDSVIEFGKNLIDFQMDEDGSSIFTSVIPLGDDNLTIDDSDYAVQSSALVNNYGIIETAVQISGIKTRSALSSAAQKIISAAENEDHPDLQIKAIDLKWIDNSKPHFIEIGDAVPIKFAAFSINKYYLCQKINFNLENPAETTYVFSYLGAEIPSETSGYSAPDNGCIKSESTLSGFVANAAKSIDAQAQSEIKRPTSVSVSSNEVNINYGTYSVKYEADGSGASRNNIRATVIQNSS